MRTSRWTANAPSRPTRGPGRRRSGIVLALLLLLCQPQEGTAWNAAGHRIVAAIAWETLSPGAREEAGRLLRRHPDAPRWPRGNRAVDDRGVFIGASTWPDDIRQDARFYTPGVDAPTPLLPGFPDMRRHSGWHVEPPPAASRSSRPESLAGGFAAQLRAFEAPDSAPAARSYALPWLIHLSGDAHQPLHASARRDRTGAWDMYGTDTWVFDPETIRKPLTTLHTFWDNLPGPPWLSGSAFEQLVARVIADVGDDATDVSAPVATWLDESGELARAAGYPDGDDPVPLIGATFREHGRQLALRRLGDAGRRLGRLLDRLLAPR